REAQPETTITTVILRAGATEPAAIALAGNPGAGPGGGRTIFLDPYTGATLGEGSKGARDFFHLVTDWRRWLGASGASRNTARAVTGACNLGFLFIVTSGIYLWWPRKRNWLQFKNILWFKRGLPDKARDFNWHNVNRKTGEVTRWEPFSSYTTGRKLRSFLRFAHTGEVAGVVGQTVAGLASFGGAFLVWTGISLALRRLRAWLSKPLNKPQTIETALKSG